MDLLRTTKKLNPDVTPIHPTGDPIQPLKPRAVGGDASQPFGRPKVGGAPEGGGLSRAALAEANPPP